MFLVFINKKTCQLLVVFLIILMSSSYARVSIYAGGGVVIPTLPEEYRQSVNTGTTLYFGMGVRYYRLNEFTMAISLDYLPDNTDNENYDAGSMSITSFLLDFRIRGLRDYQRKFRKHLIASIGFGTIGYKTAGFPDLGRLVFGFGAGTEYKISKHNFLWLDIKANVMTGTKKDFYGESGMHRLVIQVQGGIRYNFANW